MRKKRVLKRQVEALGDKHLSNNFKKSHFYIGEGDGEREECVIFLINMYATSKSGYIVAQENKHDTWFKPLLVNLTDKAMTVYVFPNHVQDYALRVARHVPRYYYPVILSKKEAHRWEKSTAWKDNQIPKATGELKYF